MPARHFQEKNISVIIPAYNEEITVARVVQIVSMHPLVDEVIVVDDGSTDMTARKARDAGARVVALQKNCGKGRALQIGTKEARNPTFLFLDADIIGLNKKIIDKLVRPVLSGKYDMNIALCDRRVYFLNKFLHYAPLIGGERALTRELWESIPSMYKRRFQVEIAMNYFAKVNNRRMGFFLADGLTQIIKEKKRGLWVGLWQRALMIRDIIVVAVRLYFLHSGFSWIRRFWKFLSTWKVFLRKEAG